MRSALELVDRLVCSEYRQPIAYLFDNRDRMICDVVSSSRCSSCDEFIPLPRLKYVLGTSLCTECATSGNNDLKRPPPHPNPPANLASCPRCANPHKIGKIELKSRGLLDVLLIHNVGGQKMLNKFFCR